MQANNGYMHTSQQKIITNIGSEIRSPPNQLNALVDSSCIWCVNHFDLATSSAAASAPEPFATSDLSNEAD